MQWRKTKQRKGREHKAGLIGVSGSILSRRGGVGQAPPHREGGMCAKAQRWGVRHAPGRM